MKLICVKNIDILSKNRNPLTINKKYHVLFLKDPFNYIIEVEDDSGVKNWYPKDWFITIEEYRQQKLEELGI